MAWRCLTAVLMTAWLMSPGPLVWAQVEGLSEEDAEALGVTPPVAGDKAPIRLQLGVDVEKRLHFPAKVELGIPPERTAQLRVHNLDQTIYLTALSAFPKTRLLARELDGDRTYVLDVVAAEGVGDSTPLQIGTPDKPKPLTTTTVKLPGGPDRLRRQTVYGRYRHLIRVAAQTVHGLGRVAAPHNLKSVEVDPAPNTLVRGATVQARTTQGWTDGVLYVTAVALTNRTARSVTLDPRDLRGRWVAAAFQHTRLFPRGDPLDTTSVYLVSQVPFAEAGP